jgi:hypothetical protein
MKLCQKVHVISITEKKIYMKRPRGFCCRRLMGWANSIGYTEERRVREAMVASHTDCDCVAGGRGGGGGGGVPQYDDSKNWWASSFTLSTKHSNSIFIYER